MEIIFLYGAYGEEHFLCIEFLSFQLSSEHFSVFFKGLLNFILFPGIF